MMNETRVLLITNIITPYRISLLDCINRILNFQFKVIALAEKEANREWNISREKMNFDNDILSGLHSFIWTREIPLHLNWGLWRALRNYKPDVIITSGYNTLSYWEAFLYCKLFKKKYVLWNETTLLSTSRTDGFLGRMKRVIIKGADRYISCGIKAAEYLAYMGAPKEQIRVSINTVDMQWFWQKTNVYYQGKGFQKERAAYPKFLLLFSGQLISRKGILQVLKALSELHDPDIGFLIVGSGPQKQELRKFCQEKGLANIYFEGFQQQDALTRYYALADVFILPSFEEVWGLVINEALAGGLYVLCSDRAGAAYDLIKEGWNGTLFNCNNVEEIANLILRAKDNVGSIRARRQAISEHACAEFSIGRSAKAFVEAVV